MALGSFQLAQQACLGDDVYVLRPSRRPRSLCTPDGLLLTLFITFEQF